MLITFDSKILLFLWLSISKGPPLLQLFILLTVSFLVDEEISAFIMLSLTGQQNLKHTSNRHDEFKGLLSLTMSLLYSTTWHCLWQNIPALFELLAEVQHPFTGVSLPWKQCYFLGMWWDKVVLAIGQSELSTEPLKFIRYYSI